MRQSRKQLGEDSFPTAPGTLEAAASPRVQRRLPGAQLDETARQDGQSRKSSCLAITI